MNSLLMIFVSDLMTILGPDARVPESPPLIPESRPGLEHLSRLLSRAEGRGSPCDAKSPGQSCVPPFLLYVYPETKTE